MNLIITESQLKSIINEEVESFEIIDKAAKGFNLIPVTGNVFVNSFTTLNGKPTKFLADIINKWIIKNFTNTHVRVHHDTIYNTLRFYLKP